jgi:hypothetical protein
MDTPQTTRERISHRLPVNLIDSLAIGIALALAALVRFGVIHGVSF